MSTSLSAQPPLPATFVHLGAAMAVLGVLGVLVVLVRRLVGRRAPSPVPAVLPALAAVVALGLFAVLTGSVRADGGATRFDAPVLTWFVQHRAPGVTSVATVITTLGSPVASALVALAAAALLYRARDRAGAGLLLVAVAVAGAAILGAKQLVGRARPPAPTQLLTETDFSFPSGHVTGALVLYGVLALVLVHRTHGPLRRVFAPVAALLVVATGTIRLYLGVHWLSDVIGAVLLGGALLLGAVATHRVLCAPATTRAQDQVDRGMIPA